MSDISEQVSLRPPEEVMRLARLGCFHGSPLSFMRQLTARAAAEAWEFSVDRWEVDAQGVGRAVLVARTPVRSYALVAFFHDLPDAQRSDRVIAEAWDATFTLCDDVPGPVELDRLQANVPLQEAGRISQRELTLSRANRSVRLWEHVVGALAQGQQPDIAALGAVGYLMRTTAVYGSGKFGAADRAQIADRPECAAPFQAEMLTVYLIRWAVMLLVEHMAEARGGAAAVPLDPDIARGLGIGNSTGLGMAPFLINHPRLIHNWIAARERSLAHVLGQPMAPMAWEMVEALAAIMARKVATWETDHPRQARRDADLARDLAHLRAHMARTGRDWQALLAWAGDALSLEGQEWLVSAMLEPYAEALSEFAAQMSAPETPERVAGRQTVAALRAAIVRHYGWALEIDWDAPEAAARAWYVSEEKLEPRLGERWEEPIAPYEQPLAPGRDVARLAQVLTDWPDDSPVAAVALAHGGLRHAIRRVQIVCDAPYGEIRDNTISADMMPIDLLRAKLAFFGAQRFDPRSDRWLRICMFAGAPLPTDLSPQTERRWPYWSAPWERETERK